MEQHRAGGLHTLVARPPLQGQGPSSRFFQHDVQEARKLLEAIGALGASMPFQYAGARYGRTFQAIADATADALGQIGRRPAVDVQDYASRYLPRTFNGDFTGIAFGYETPFPEVGGYFTRLFGDDPANHGCVRDQRIAELDQRQRVERDEAKRRELIWEIQWVHVQRMHYVPSQEVEPFERLAQEEDRSSGGMSSASDGGSRAAWSGVCPR